MGVFIDITGMKYGRLTVISRTANDKFKKAMWLCQCECGNPEMIEVVGSHLRNGNTKSCGCWHIDTITKHDESKNRIYSIYRGIKQRCYNIKNDGYENYGGRGIKVCDEWLGENGFRNFLDWSKNNGYSDELSIDRIDVNGNYEPNNCRWATRTEQASNRRTNTFVTINGITKTMRGWEVEYNLSEGTILRRITWKWDENELLKPPKKSCK